LSRQKNAQQQQQLSLRCFNFALISVCSKSAFRYSVNAASFAASSLIFDFEQFLVHQSTMTMMMMMSTLFVMCVLVLLSSHSVHAGTFVLKDAPVLAQQMSMRFGVFGPDDTPYAQSDNNVTYVSIKRMKVSQRSNTEPR
jgi:hypothetical protein